MRVALTMGVWWALVVAGWACGAAAPALRPEAAAVPDMAAEKKLELEKRVEVALLPAVQVVGEPEQYALAERMAALKVPGLSVAVFDEGGLVWAKGYGLADVSTGAPVTQRTLFQAGSISKSVNALAVLLEAASGALDLDAPVNARLGSWHLPDNELTQHAPVTLRRLLSHTAGTTVHGFPGYPTGAALPSLVDVLDGHEPANTPPVRVDLVPGGQFRYSGGGTTITQLLLVDTFHKPYPSLLRELVLGPLGMGDSSYEQPLPPERLAQAAAGHLIDGSQLATKRHVYPEMAAAGLWTTPADLAVFFREVALARAGRSTRLSQAVAQQMTTAVATEPGAGARPGLGVFLFERNGVPLFGHNGADAGFQADALVSLEGAHGVVMMANSDNGLRLFPEIERTVFAAMGWPGADVPVARAPSSAAERAAWLGDFVVPGEVPFTIGMQGERLSVLRPFSDPVELILLGPKRAVHRDRGLYYSLRDDGFDILTTRGPVATAMRLPAGKKVPLLELAAGRSDSAIQAWRAQIAEAPNTPGVGPGPGIQLGQELLRDGKVDAALTVLRTVATVCPWAPMAHVNLAVAYAASGDEAAASAAYKEALLKLESATWIPPEQQRQIRAGVQHELEALNHTSEAKP